METVTHPARSAAAGHDPFAALFSKWESTANAHDAKGWSSNFSKDAILMPAGTHAIIRGHDGIVKWAEGAVSVWNSLGLQRGPQQVDGSQGWASGTFTGNVNMPDGKKVDLTGSYLTTLHKSGQDWKVVAAIWNVNLPEQPTASA